MSSDLSYRARTRMVRGAARDHLRRLRADRLARRDPEEPVAPSAGQQEAADVQPPPPLAVSRAVSQESRMPEPADLSHASPSQSDDDTTGFSESPSFSAPSDTPTVQAACIEEPETEHSEDTSPTEDLGQNLFAAPSEDEKPLSQAQSKPADEAASVTSSTSDQALAPDEENPQGSGHLEPPGPAPADESIVDLSRDSTEVEPDELAEPAAGSSSAENESEQETPPLDASPDESDPDEALQPSQTPQLQVGETFSESRSVAGETALDATAEAEFPPEEGTQEEALDPLPGLDQAEAEPQSQLLETLPTDENAPISPSEPNPEVTMPDASKSDLYCLRGAGAGLVWMLEQCGVHTLADLAAADPAILQQRMGLIGQILDLEDWVNYAKASIADEQRGA